MKLYIVTDGACRGNPGPSSAAAVFFNEAGEKLLEASKFLGRKTNNQAEYEAIILALEKAIEMGIDGDAQIELLSDSKTCVNQMAGANIPKKLFELWEHANTLSKTFTNIEFKHIPRDYSKDADRLANKVLDEKGIGTENVPQFLKAKFQ